VVNEMNETHDTNDIETAEDDQPLDPRDAAVLLEQTRKQAQRQFSLRPPVFTLLLAALALLAYGALWWSVRGQHPYQGPSGGVILAVYAGVLVIVIGSATIIRRATRGVSGPSLHQQRAYGIAYATAYIAEAVFQGALKNDGFNNAIVYGVFPAAAPLLVVGACLCGMAAANENWRLLATAVAVVALGTGAAFAGPINVWGIIAIGGCVMLVGYAATQLWERHRPVIVRA
jgi:hypothetical protein